MAQLSTDVTRAAGLQESSGPQSARDAEIGQQAREQPRDKAGLVESLGGAEHRASYLAGADAERLPAQEVVAGVTGGLGQRVRAGIEWLVSPSVRSAMARETAINELASSNSDSRISAVQRLGGLLDSGSAESARGASVDEAVTALRGRLHDERERVGVREAALEGLVRYYTVDGKLEDGFAREAARLLKTNVDVSLQIKLTQAIANSGDRFAQQVLLETITGSGPLVADAAAGALKRSFGRSFSAEMSHELSGIVSGAVPVASDHHRAAALLAFSASGFPAQINVVAPIISDPGQPSYLRERGIHAFKGSFNGDWRAAVLTVATQDQSSPPSLVGAAREAAREFARGTVLICESGEKVRL